MLNDERFPQINLVVYLFSSLGEFVENVENPSRLDNAPTGEPRATTRAAFRKKRNDFRTEENSLSRRSVGIHFQKGETDTPESK